jgi:hypothetical protein
MVTLENIRQKIRCIFSNILPQFCLCFPRQDNEAPKTAFSQLQRLNSSNQHSGQLFFSTAIFPENRASLFVKTTLYAPIRYSLVGHSMGLAGRHPGLRHSH